MSIVSKCTIGAIASKKASAVGPGFGPDRFGERRRRQRARGDDRLVPVGGRQARDFLATDGDERMRFEPRRHRRGKAVAVHRERAAGRHLVGVAAGHDQRPGKPHLGVQQPDRIGFGVVRPERIGADQFGKPVGLVRLGAAHAAASREGRPARPPRPPARLPPSRRGRRR